MSEPLIIRMDFRELIPPPKEDELSQLEANIIKEGCREPLIAWMIPPGEDEIANDFDLSGDALSDSEIQSTAADNGEDLEVVGRVGKFALVRKRPNRDYDDVGKWRYEWLIAANSPDANTVLWETGQNILLDGHNRYDICKRHGLSFDVHFLAFDDESAAKNWMILNQLGRRNLDPKAAAELRGKLYRGRRDEHGGDRKSKSQNETLIALEDQPDTATQVARETGVSRNTVLRDAKYSEAVDKLKEMVKNGAISEEDRASLMKGSKAGVISAAMADAPNATKAKKIKLADIGIGLDRADRAIRWLNDIPKSDCEFSMAMEKVIGYCNERKAQ